MIAQATIKVKRKIPGFDLQTDNRFCVKKQKLCIT